MIHEKQRQKIRNFREKIFDRDDTQKEKWSCLKYMIQLTLTYITCCSIASLAHHDISCKMSHTWYALHISDQYVDLPKARLHSFFGPGYHKRQVSSQHPSINNSWPPHSDVWDDHLTISSHTLTISSNHRHNHVDFYFLSIVCVRLLWTPKAILQSQTQVNRSLRLPF